MSREEQLSRVRETLASERFAVFAFAGKDSAPPYTTVMFFAELPDLGIVFATHPGPSKGPFARDGNGACAQIDNRNVGLDRMAEFTRITLQGHLEQVPEGARRAELHRLYLAKLPFAGVFLDRPGIETFVLRPSRVICARGFAERFELELPAGAAPG